MDDSVVRIMISTDNHLGFMEKDSVRCDDSFAAFEEVFVRAKQQSADFILLAGDVFHENKPSRRTLHAAMDILNKYCYGQEPVYLEVLNDESEVFQTRNKRVNYEDPFQSISLPVFSIHGNHDDPTREGGHESLAAMDLLSVTNLVNYFGKSNEVDNIEITPILFRKQGTCIALYGLGAVRDERLNRMWNQKKVKFVRPNEEQGRDDFFNIFVLHQNRDYGRGSKNCIHESMIPEWMDIVIWGNEHECQPRLCESLVGTFRIYQPGSSVATSMVDGESVSMPKHMGLLEIRGKQFRLQTTKFSSNRVFIYNEIALSTVEGLQAQDPQIEEKIAKVLKNKVEAMMKDAREVEKASEPLGVDTIYNIRSPDQYLLRLKVDHIGFPSLNQNRFSANFVGKVANPSELLLFSKKKKEVLGRPDHKPDRDFLRSVMEDGGDEEINKIRIDDLVRESLRNSKRPLGLLVEETLTQALEDFILKKASGAIGELVEDTLDETRKVLFGEADAEGRDKIIEMVSRHKQTIEASILKGERLPIVREGRSAVYGEEDESADHEERSDEEESKPRRAASKSRAPKKAAAKTAAKKANATGKLPNERKVVGGNDDRDREEDLCPPKKTVSRALTKRSYVEDVDEDVQEDFSVASEDFGEDIQDDSEEEFKKPKAKARASQKSKAGRIAPSNSSSGRISATQLKGEVIYIDDDDNAPNTYLGCSNKSEMSIAIPTSNAKSKKRQLPLSFASQHESGSVAKKSLLTKSWE